VAQKLTPWDSLAVFSDPNQGQTKTQQPTTAMENGMHGMGLDQVDQI
jgi:hypothetical protein